MFQNPSTLKGDGDQKFIFFWSTLLGYFGYLGAWDRAMSDIGPENSGF